MIVLICEKCGKKYKQYPSRKKTSHYCSKACFDEARRHYRICEWCEKKFRVCLWDVTQGNARFCSKKCRGKAERQENIHRCPCGKYFHRKPSQICKSGHVYCSKTCWQLYKKKGTKCIHPRPLFQATRLA